MDYHIIINWMSPLFFRGVRSDFYFLCDFLMKFLCANRIAPDGMLRSAASHLGHFCLPRDARLKCVKNNIFLFFSFFNFELV